MYLFIYLFFLPFMLPPEIPRLATDLPVRVLPCVWNLLFFKTPFPGWISVPTSFVSLFLFYILSYLLSKTIGCLSRCLMASAIIQKLFCGICSAFRFSFDEFLGEKVVSSSYSSAVLGPPLETWDPNSTTRIWTHSPCTGSTVLFCFVLIWTFIFCVGIAD